MSSLPRVLSGINDEINQVISGLVEDGWVDDQNAAFVRYLGKGRWEVSFTGSEYISIDSGWEHYEQYYKYLTDHRSFNARLLDGGIIQFQYLFDQNDLVKHRLVYFPSPYLRKFQLDPDAYFNDELYLEVVSRHVILFPIRFDYDAASAQDVEHPACHLTLGDFKGCRIPVSRPLTPCWFADFVLRNFYRTEHFNPTAKLPDQSISFQDTISPNEKTLIHLVIPNAASRV